jgi:hypothetical protein
LLGTARGFKRDQVAALGNRFEHKGEGASMPKRSGDFPIIRAGLVGKTDAATI